LFSLNIFLYICKYKNLKQQIIMDEKLYIPKKINVGYNKRDDTYSGKLAYVIYWDAKGKLRKETSWQGWRDKKIPPTAFENVPTEGFVLNRNVGGARSGGYSWDARLEKVRVYDPRGFEFEITIPNVLFILQECTSVKGKGLDGEFVYAWSGPELVLLPVCCAEYKSSNEFTNLQAKKVGKTDIVEGCAYMTKDSINLIYIGKFDYNFINRYSHDDKVTLCKKQHIFYNAAANRYYPYDGFTKLASRITDVPVDNYAELVEKFTTGRNGSKIIGLYSEPMSIKMKNSYGSLCPVEIPYLKLSENRFKSVYINEISTYSFKEYDKKKEGVKFCIRDCEFIHFVNDELFIKSSHSETDNKKYSIEELNSLNFCQLFVILEGGKKIKLNEYFK